MIRRALYLILALLISAAPILIFSTPAFASTPSSQSSAPGGFICSAKTTTSGASSSYLPIHRWGGVSASEFTYLSGGPIGTVANLPNQSNKAIVGLILSAGNSMWSATSSLTSIAEQFCFGAQAAGAANGVTAGLWKFISQGDILSILIVVGVILLVWRARKGVKIGREVIRIVVVAAIISTLGVESARTTTAGAQAGRYPGFSPAWIVSTAYGAISAVVSVPLAGINTLAGTAQIGGGTSGKGYGTGCASYTDELLTKYKQSYGTNAATQSEAVVPEVVNAIWDNSGLQSTAAAQFGHNKYAANAYCHLYEQEAGVTPAAQIAIARSAGKIPPNPNPQSLAFLPRDASSKEIVASMVGWAACTTPNNTQLKPSPTWAGVQHQPPFSLTAPGSLGNPFGAYVTHVASKQQAITASDCQQWWSTPVSSWNWQNSPIYWGASTSTISSATSNAPGVASFLLNFFGDSSTSSFITAIVYAISSLAVLITFGLLSLAVIVAKFGLLLLMALFIIFLVVDLVPGKGGGHHASKFLKQGVSFMVLAIGAEAILGLVALMTSIITRFGVVAVGDGIAGMLWIALSPVAAIWSIHHILKTFRIPSPFRPDAAMGWASAAGAGGFLTGAMVERLAGGYNRLRGSGAAATKAGARRVGGAAAASLKPDKRLYGPRGSGSQMPSKNIGGTGWRESGSSAGGRAAGVATATRARSAKTTSPSGREWAQRSAASRPAATAAMATAALDKFRNDNNPSQRWSLNRPAQKPVMINGVPYRTPSQMRLEGAQKAANQRKAARQQKSSSKWQPPPPPHLQGSRGVTSAPRASMQDAKKWARQQAGPLPQRLASTTGERAQLAWARAKANPGKAIARAAGYGAAAAVMLPLGAPVAVGALAAHYGVKKARTAMQEHPARKAEKMAHLSYISRNILAEKTQAVKLRHPDKSQEKYNKHSTVRAKKTI